MEIAFGESPLPEDIEAQPQLNAIDHQVEPFQDVDPFRHPEKR